MKEVNNTEIEISNNFEEQMFKKRKVDLKGLNDLENILYDILRWEDHFAASHLFHDLIQGHSCANGFRESLGIIKILNYYREKELSVDTMVCAVIDSKKPDLVGQCIAFISELFETCGDNKKLDELEKLSSSLKNYRNLLSFFAQLECYHPKTLPGSVLSLLGVKFVPDVSFVSKTSGVCSIKNKQGDFCIFQPVAYFDFKNLYESLIPEKDGSMSWQSEHVDYLSGLVSDIYKCDIELASKKREMSPATKVDIPAVEVEMDVEPVMKADIPAAEVEMDVEPVNDVAEDVPVLKPLVKTVSMARLPDCNGDIEQGLGNDVGQSLEAQETGSVVRHSSRKGYYHVESLSKFLGADQFLAPIDELPKGVVVAPNPA